MASKSHVVLSKSVEKAIKTICMDAQTVSLEDGGTLYGVQTLPSPISQERDFYVDCIDITASKRGYKLNSKDWGLFFQNVRRINPDYGVLGGYHTHPKNYGAVPKTNEDLDMLKMYQRGNKFEVIADMTDQSQIKAWKLNSILNRPEELEVIVDENRVGHGVVGVINQYLNMNNNRTYQHPLKRVFQS